MKQVLYILFWAIIMQACSSGSVYIPEPTPPDPTNKSKSYIADFIINPEFEAGYNKSSEFGSIATPYDKKYWISSGQEFDKLCAKYGDESYNKETRSAPVYADEFTEIDIVCDIDFDAEHPAGISLADITMIHASSPLEYIKSNYKNHFPWNSAPKGFKGNYLGVEPGFHPIYKLVSELQPEDMILLQFSIRFTFTKPRPEGKQTYTITLKTADKTYSASCEIE